MEIILDIGSGTNVRDWDAMIDRIKDNDSGMHRIVFKTQLFTDIPPNKPVDHGDFESIYWYAQERGYDLTASVFDTASLEFLLGYDVPFVKIACRQHLYPLIDEVPGDVAVYASTSKRTDAVRDATVYLACIPEYPAPKDDYYAIYYELRGWAGNKDAVGISDHTVGLDLVKDLRPPTWECHLKLESSTGPDAGPWAKTPAELQEIL